MANVNSCDGGICDYNYLRHPGWNENNQCIQTLFSPEIRDLISRKVSQLTMGVDLKNRKIIVPDSTICSIIDANYQNYRPPVGDIHSRYIIPNNEQENMVQSIIDQTIEVITNNIRGQLGMEQENQKLTAWVQLYGDFNLHNLTQVPPIKTQEKRPRTMLFNMNY